MDHNDDTGQQSSRRRRRAWADVKEVLEEYGPDGSLIKKCEKWIYTSPKKEQEEEPIRLNWPNARDLWNLVIGAAALLLMAHLRGFQGPPM